jgi:hypothetical protein
MLSAETHEEIYCALWLMGLEELQIEQVGAVATPRTWIWLAYVLIATNPFFFVSVFHGFLQAAEVNTKGHISVGSDYPLYMFIILISAT